MRPEVKVTVIYKQYVTLCDPRMYPNTKFGIPSSNNIGDVPEVEVVVTPKQYGTPWHPTGIHNLNLGFLPKTIQDKCSGHDFSRTSVRRQGQCHRGIQHGYHATVCMPGCKPNHV